MATPVENLLGTAEEGSTLVAYVDLSSRRHDVDLGKELARACANEFWMPFRVEDNPVEPVAVHYSGNDIPNLKGAWTVAKAFRVRAFADGYLKCASNRGD